MSIIQVAFASVTVALILRDGGLKTPCRWPYRGGIYTSIAERIALADKQIARLTALSASRTALVEKTNALLLERQEALAKSTAALTAVETKKAKLVAAASKPPKVPREKLSPEERKARMAAGRAAKKAENEKYKALIDALKTSGKSVEELLSELKG